MDLDDIGVSPELLERVKACTSPEELLAMAESEGYELSDKDLDTVSGGWDCPLGPVTGETREGIDPAKAHADFVNGVIDGGELD